MNLKRFGTVAALVIGAAALPMLMGPSGGIPSFLTIQRLTATSQAGASGYPVQSVSASPGVLLYDTGGTANNRKFATLLSGGVYRGRLYDDALSTGVSYLDVTASGGAISITDLRGTSVRLNGTDVTPATGSFVVTFDDACTTSPTITYVYQKIGNVVTIMQTASSGFPCTGDSTVFGTSSATVPAAIRPVTNPISSMAVPGALDNATDTSANILLGASGLLQFQRVTSAGLVTSWTAAGNRRSPVNAAWTYMINN